MTDVQRADLEAAKRGKLFNDDPDVPIASITDDTMPDILAGIVNGIKDVEKAEAAQQHDSGDVADIKEEKKIEMGEAVIKYALRGEVKAAFLGLDDVETALQHPLSWITDADDILSVTRAKDMRDTMDANKGPGGPLTNIVAADILIIDNAIKGFTDIEKDPTALIKEKKAQGTDKIQPALDILNKFIDAEKKILHSYWDGTDKSAFVDQFELDTHPIILGRRHNIVDVILLKDEDGSALKNALVTSIKNGKTSDGNNTNIYRIEGIQSGSKPFRAEAPNRIPVDFDVVVKRRTTTVVVIRMKLI